MRADITNIPIAEVFEPRDGCPLCRMRDMLENRVVEYITGAAMMEPDVRADTNAQGFCLTHFRMMLQKRNRLGVALMLESHLAHLDKDVFKGPPLIGKKPDRQGRSAGKSTGTCFVCSQTEWAEQRLTATIYRLYGTDRTFRVLFAAQEYLCLPHFSSLTAGASAVDKKHAAGLLSDASALARRRLVALHDDLLHFARMFDYRNSSGDADWGDSKDAIERAISFLTGRNP